jgi:hypothetical protein
MIRAKLTAGIAVSALTLLGASLASGTTVQKLSLSDLARNSNAIVRATVEDQTSRQDDASKEIYTYITLRVLDPVKGSKGESIVTLRQLGGQVGNIASIVPGLPTFSKGEEVVVFLTASDRAGYPWVMGLQQGKYTVRTDPKGVKYVRNDLEAALPGSAKGADKAGGKKVADLTLESFLARIHTEIGDEGRIQVAPSEPE